MKVQILFLLVLDNPPKEEPEDDIDASVKRDNKNLIIPEMVVPFFYLIEFHEILGIKLSIDYWLESCIHLI